MENKIDKKVISDRASKLSNKNITQENVKRLTNKTLDFIPDEEENIEKTKTRKTEKNKEKTLK